MINAIAELGQFNQGQDSNSKLDIWLEDSYHQKNYPHLLLIEFIKNEKGKWQFSGVSYREHSAQLKGKLLYKRGSSRGSDKTPTCKVAKGIESSFQQKIVNWFSGASSKDFLNDKERLFIQEISNVITEKSLVIKELLVEKQNTLSKGGVVLSCTFNQGGNDFFVGEKTFFSKFIIEESKADYMYSKTFNKYSCAKNKVCSICQKNQEEVYGYFTSLKFYTVDKPGMVSGGFQQDKSWKNYPVCLNCALNIEKGIQVIEAKLDFQFYGLKYYFIPKLLLRQNKEDIINDILNLEMRKEQKVNAKLKKRITNDEGEILEYATNYNNQIAFTLLFYDKPQKVVFRILASIEELLPSTLSKLFNAKDYVDNAFAFMKKDNQPLFNFNFGFLRTFFPNNKVEGNFNKAFLEMVQKIFSSSYISYSYLLKHYMKHLRYSFVHDQFFWHDTIKGFILLNFLRKLHLLDSSTRKENMDIQFFTTFSITSKNEFEEKVQLFFRSFDSFFSQDSHKAIFLLGVLTQFLLNVQKRERQATPFRSRLKGLKMDSRDIATLLPQLIEKLEQYRANYYTSLEELISKHLLSAGDYRQWNIAVDEMNYIFALGMNLSKHFKIQSEIKENKNE
ncbi:TIGR02556 family CRISPR-associated protein [Candidatus Uabimicrobium sp. HlEnr_7]|uniref:TIGR02556 family CRISPR-associated protein n=1 Tax=Candidatus Uabimicrobium helgolandensis TaxID=3095367 RepID=UPI00355655C5